jgi:hypothetical protein
MIGFGVLINDVINDSNAQRQTRIQILDRQMQCGPDVAVIDFAWEKYHLASANFQPVVTRGRGSVLISGLGSGLTGQWRISGLVGDSPLRSSSIGADGQLTATPPSASYSASPVSCSPGTVSGSISATSPGSFTNSAQVFFTPPSSCSVIAGTTTQCTIAANPLFTVNSASSPGANTTSCTPVTTGTLTSSSPSFNFQATGNTSFSGAAGATINVNIPVAFAGLATGGFGWSGNYNIGSTCNANITLTSAAPPVCSVTPGSVPVALEVRDADVTTPSLLVNVTSSNGDAENFVLPQVSPGVYRLASLPVTRGGASVSPGNGRIDFVGNSTGTVTLTVRYIDQRSATGAPVTRQTTVSLF